MSAHSPTPWKLDGIAGRPAAITAADGGHRIRIVEVCGSMSNPDIAADAAFIVHAVNLHDEMVAALRMVANQYEILDMPKYVVNAVDAALSKSTPTQEMGCSVPLRRLTPSTGLDGE